VGKKNNNDSCGMSDFSKTGLSPAAVQAVIEQQGERARRKVRLQRFFNEQVARQEQNARERAETLADEAAVAAMFAAGGPADPARVRALYDRLEELDRASARAMIEADRRVQETERALEELRRRAALDEHGRRVYRTADGKRAFREDGTELTQQQMDAVDWKGGEPTWEEHQKPRHQVDAAIEEREQIGEFRDRIDTQRRRIDNGGDLSADELAAFEEELEDMPDAVRAQVDNQTVSSPAANRSAGLPDVGGAFNRLRFGPDEPVHFPTSRT
jgi:hypothetical protein